MNPEGERRGSSSPYANREHKPINKKRNSKRGEVLTHRDSKSTNNQLEASRVSSRTGNNAKRSDPQLKTERSMTLINKVGSLVVKRVNRRADEISAKILREKMEKEINEMYRNLLKNHKKSERSLAPLVFPTLERERRKKQGFDYSEVSTPMSSAFASQIHSRQRKHSASRKGSRSSRFRDGILSRAGEIQSRGQFSQKSQTSKRVSIKEIDHD